MNASEAAQVRPNDTLSRLIGMAIGAVVGTAVFFLLGTYARVDGRWLLGIPGVGLGLGAGLFSYRRSWSWGIAAAILGFCCSVFVLWQFVPPGTGLFAVAEALVSTMSGLGHVVVITLVGLLVGAGWQKSVMLDGQEDGGAGSPSG